MEKIHHANSSQKRTRPGMPGTQLLILGVVSLSPTLDVEITERVRMNKWTRVAIQIPDKIEFKKNVIRYKGGHIIMNKSVHHNNRDTCT